MTKHVIIVGSGPAGLTAAVYCATAGFKTTVITGKDLGGNIAKTNSIINWPSMEEISGADLADNMVSQCEKLGVNFVFDIMTYYNSDTVFLESAGAIFFDALILALGTEPKRLTNLSDKVKVHYCATCDGFLYKDKHVAVIGGGDSAITQAIYLANMCKTVTVFTRSGLKAKQHLIKSAKECLNIRFKQYDETIDSTNHFDGVFVAIGATLPNFNELTYLIPHTKENIFLAGDLTKPHQHRQAVIAAADGAVAAINATEYLLTRK